MQFPSLKDIGNGALSLCKHTFKSVVKHPVQAVLSFGMVYKIMSIILSPNAEGASSNQVVQSEGNTLTLAQKAAAGGLLIFMAFLAGTGYQLIQIIRNNRALLREYNRPMTEEKIRAMNPNNNPALEQFLRLKDSNPAEYARIMAEYMNLQSSVDQWRLAVMVVREDIRFTLRLNQTPAEACEFEDPKILDFMVKVLEKALNDTCRPGQKILNKPLFYKNLFEKLNTCKQQGQEINDMMIQRMAEALKQNLSHYQTNEERTEAAPQGNGDAGMKLACEADEADVEDNDEADPTPTLASDSTADNNSMDTSGSVGFTPLRAGLTQRRINSSSSSSSSSSVGHRRRNKPTAVSTTW